MRFAACALVVFGACQGGGDDAFPVIPQGDDSPITPMLDAPPADASGDGATSLAGRACVLADLRNLTSCANQGADGLAVTLGANSALTTADGSFSISAPAGGNVAWNLSAPGYVTSVMALGTVHLIPAVTTVVFDQALLDNGVILQAGQGSVIGRVVQQGANVAGVTAQASPTPGYATFYDGVSAALWDQDATGSFGVFWLTGVAQGSSAIVVTPPSMIPVAVTVPVVDQAITFVTIELP